jgi:hypothetical protein
VDDRKWLRHGAWPDEVSVAKDFDTGERFAAETDAYPFIRGR